MIELGFKKLEILNLRNFDKNRQFELEDLKRPMTME